MKKALFLALFVLTLVSIKASAWVEPKEGEEIPAVLNTGSTGQEKKGWLNVGDWIRVLKNPFSFDVGMEAPKFCIKKPDGTQSCCPPNAGEDWSACGGGGNGGGVDAKWVYNSSFAICTFYVQIKGNTYAKFQDEITGSSYSILTIVPDGSIINDMKKCTCSVKNIISQPLDDFTKAYIKLSIALFNYNFPYAMAHTKDLCLETCVNRENVDRYITRIECTEY